MILKYAKNGEQFRKEAKEYVINMTGEKKKLHRKCGCYWSRYLHKYYDFNNLHEAKNSGVESTLCGYCFKDR